MPESHRRSEDARETETGLRFIVFYKLAKGIAQVAIAIVLAILVRRGSADHLHDFAETIRHHATGAWSVHIADFLLRIANARALHLTSLAFAVDGSFTLLEGWSLHRRYAWGPWLVIVASSSLVPIELFEIARHPRIGRVIILALNVAIVLYLIRRVQNEKRRAGA